MVMLTPLDIELVLNSHCQHSKQTLITVAENYLEKLQLRPNSIISNFDNWSQEDKPKYGHLFQHIVIGDVPDPVTIILDLKKCNVNWFIYSLDADEASLHVENDSDGCEVNMASHISLPSKSLFQLWESLFYEKNIKGNLLKYARTMMKFSDKKVNSTLVNCNKVILLHGPPGTGKTSLCKALAQKLSIQMKNSFPTGGCLIEINSHSLFSKYFSESAKLVHNMFTKIRLICEDKNILVCVLMDEVESLTRARDQCSSGSEPSDAIRVVNAMLTQIDNIKQYPNVLILATSNLTGTIDLAFVDRADVKEYLGLPGIPAIYNIYYSSITELIRVNIIKGDDISDQAGDTGDRFSQRLTKICEKSIGLSGRSLRKIPFLADALFLKGNQPDVYDFLDAMEQAIEKELSDRNYFIAPK
ncbi:unnamed protein product [Ceutorhynchus assimilis]|uniref:AAA+ ATPase domain-containing protein n=1 Tax=Ceutorhynchus assimilis TaxID=467358 RepID=A0A9N9QNV6_9CUCU|nr:unnamed protein product [Ceutorhynchus assimilis]